MPLDALLKFYIGKCLRQDLSQQFANQVLDSTAKVLARHHHSEAEVIQILQEIRLNPSNSCFLIALVAACDFRIMGLESSGDGTEICGTEICGTEICGTEICDFLKKSQIWEVWVFPGHELRQMP